MELNWEEWGYGPQNAVLFAEGGIGHAAWIHPHTHEFVINGTRCRRSEKPGYVVELYDPHGTYDGTGWEIVADGIEDIETAKAVAVVCWRLR